MSLGQSWSISNRGQWTLSEQELLATFSVQITWSLEILAPATIGQRDSMFPSTMKMLITVILKVRN